MRSPLRLLLLLCLLACATVQATTEMEAAVESAVQSSFLDIEVDAAIEMAAAELEEAEALHASMLVEHSDIQSSSAALATEVTEFESLLDSSSTVDAETARRFGGIGRKLGSVGRVVSRVATKVQKVQQIVSKVQGMAKSLNGISKIASIASKATSIAGKVSMFAGAFKHAAKSVSKISSKVGGIAGKVKKMAAAGKFGKFSKIIGSVAGKVQKVSNTVSKVSDKAAIIAGKVERIADMVDTFTNPFKMMTDPGAFREGMQMVGEVAHGVQKLTASGKLGKFGKVLNKVAGGVSKATDVVDRVVGKYEEVTGAITSLSSPTSIGDIRDGINTLKDNVGSLRRRRGGSAPATAVLTPASPALGGTTSASRFTTTGRTSQTISHYSSMQAAANLGKATSGLTGAARVAAARKQASIDERVRTKKRRTTRKLTVPMPLPNGPMVQPTVPASPLITPNVDIPIGPDPIAPGPGPVGPLPVTPVDPVLPTMAVIPVPSNVPTIVDVVPATVAPIHIDPVVVPPVPPVVIAPVTTDMPPVVVVPPQPPAVIQIDPTVAPTNPPVVVIRNDQPVIVQPQPAAPTQGPTPITEVLKTIETSPLPTLPANVAVEPIITHAPTAAPIVEHNGNKQITIPGEQPYQPPPSPIDTPVTPSAVPTTPSVEQVVKKEIAQVQQEQQMASNTVIQQKTIQEQLNVQEKHIEQQVHQQEAQVEDKARKFALTLQSSTDDFARTVTQARESQLGELATQQKQFFRQEVVGKYTQEETDLHREIQNAERVMSEHAIKTAQTAHIELAKELGLMHADSDELLSVEHRALLTQQSAAAEIAQLQSMSNQLKAEINGAQTGVFPGTAAVRPMYNAYAPAAQVVAQPLYNSYVAPATPYLAPATPYVDPLVNINRPVVVDRPYIRSVPLLQRRMPLRTIVTPLI